MSASNGANGSRVVPVNESHEKGREDWSLASRLVHADDKISVHRAVAPAMHVSTTFRYSNDPSQLSPDQITDPAAPNDSHVYSRYTNPNTNRLEAVLTSILGGRSLSYASGLSAFHAMIVHLNPKRIAMRGGYHGCHGIVDIHHRLSGLQKIDLDDEFQAGDMVHVETPLNPTGEAFDLQHYADRAHRAGAVLTVDATFAPPPLQDPFRHGADIVMHSGTKYFGGHSDMLCGVLALSEGMADRWESLLKDRMLLGTVLGSLEGWLGIRSLRTLELRIMRQSQTATALVKWLAEQAADSSTAAAATVERVQHASLQPEAKDENSWLRKQMPGGFGPVFALWMKDEEMAKSLPSKLQLFQHATSLGGVESLIEWRAMSDNMVDRRVLRVSIGLEGLEDIKADFERAFEALKG